MCAFVAADYSLSDEDVCEDISECVHAECALPSDVNKHVNTASDQNQSWRSRNVGSVSSIRREIRRAGLVDERAIGLVIKIAEILLEIDQHLAARRGRGTPTGAEMCRRLTRST